MKFNFSAFNGLLITALGAIVFYFGRSVVEKQESTANVVQQLRVELSAVSTQASERALQFREMRDDIKDLQYSVAQLGGSSNRTRSPKDKTN